MSEQGGRWVIGVGPDGASRQDWRPDDQPPSPDGTSGSWHVVSADGEASRWEWVPLAVVPVPPPGSVPSTAPSASAAGATQTTFLPSPTTAPTAAPRGSRLGARFLSRRGLVTTGVALVLAIGGFAASQVLLGGGGSKDSTLVTDPASGRLMIRGQVPTEVVASAISTTFGPFQPSPDGRFGTMQVTFTNNAAEPHSFEATLLARSAPGEPPIYQEAVPVDGLVPGTSLTMTVFNGVPADRVQAVASATSFESVIISQLTFS